MYGELQISYPAYLFQQSCEESCAWQNQRENMKKRRNMKLVTSDK